MGRLSLSLGHLGALVMLVLFIPGLGPLNFYLVPIALFGALLGIGALTRDNEDARLAIGLNLFVALVGCIRLTLGLGVL